MSEQTQSEQSVSDHIEVPPEFLPMGVSASSFSPSMLRLAAKAHNRTVLPIMEMKPWVVLYLLDRAGL